QKGNGTIDAPGTDGILRLFSFAPFGGAAQSANAYVSVGIPAAVAFAGVNQILARNLAGLGLVACLALEAAWVGGNLFIVRQVQALVRATKRVAAGELGVRTELPQRQGELSQLASAFDEMAESLDRNRQLAEALEQQTATSEILGVIASSPTHLQPVLDVVAENAARVCGADDATIRLVEGNMLRRGAHPGHIPATQVPELTINRGSGSGRGVIRPQLIYIADLIGVAETEVPLGQTNTQR